MCILADTLARLRQQACQSARLQEGKGGTKGLITKSHHESSISHAHFNDALKLPNDLSFYRSTPNTLQKIP